MLSLFTLARQYREASKLAAEEKEFFSKIEKIKQNIEKVDAELSLKNSLLSQLSGEFSTLKEERSALEKEEGISCNQPAYYFCL